MAAIVEGSGARTAVLVLGMHRSGTSVLAQLLARLGAAPPRDPNPPAPDNPEGYWEPAGVVRLHDRMLSAADSAWLDTRPLDLGELGEERLRGFAGQLRAALADSFGDAPCFVLKDPRICRMVPFHRDVLAGMGIAVKVVMALREPADVAASLFARNQISPDYAGFLWARHLLEAERHTRDLPRIVVPYGALVDDWRATAQRIAGFLAPELPPADLDQVPSPVRADLRHHRFGAYTPFSGPLAELLGELHAALERLPAGDAGDGPEDGADGGVGRFDRLAERLSAVSARFADLLAAEFCFQRLTSPYDTVMPADPRRERQTLAEALGRLHRLQWRADAERR